MHFIEFDAIYIMHVAFAAFAISCQVCEEIFTIRTVPRLTNTDIFLKSTIDQNHFLFFYLLEKL